MPIEFELHYRYANGVEMEVRSGGVRMRFEGTKGWVGNKDWRGRLEASSDEILHTKYAPGKSKLWPLPKGEHRNFLDCVKSRQADHLSGRGWPAAEHGDAHRQHRHRTGPQAEVGPAEGRVRRRRRGQQAPHPAREDWKKA